MMNKNTSKAKGLYANADGLSHKKVLLVDDDMRNIFALQLVLDEVGCEVIVATTGQDALEQLEKQSDIDLVLMDIMMPEMDGFEAIRQIRTRLKLNMLPIIALTAKAMNEDKEACLAAGASDYLPKPVDVEALLLLLKVWLKDES